MTAERLKEIKARIATVQSYPVLDINTEGWVTADDVARIDAAELVAEVERLHALLMPSRPDLSGLSREELAARGVYVRDIQPATNEELGIIVTVKDE